MNSDRFVKDPLVTISTIVSSKSSADLKKMINYLFHRVDGFIPSTSETGIAHECIKYSRNKKLPIHFIIEDNKKSVCTDTRSAWSQKKLSYENVSDEYVTYYKYDLEYPHAGAGKRVQF